VRRPRLGGNAVAFFNVRAWILSAAAIVLPAAALHAALPSETDVSGRTSFAGQLLIASPDTRPPFDRAVIFMAQHNRDGALGIIINHPADRLPIAGLLKALGTDASGVTDSIRVFHGGPVGTDVGFVLHTTDYRRPDTMEIDGHIALSEAADVLRDIGLGKGPKKSLVAFGYAGWGPSQLEDEISQGSWVTAPEDMALVFDDDRAKVWIDALALHKIDR
jgi:putative transcriptional regulator